MDFATIIKKYSFIVFLFCYDLVLSALHIMGIWKQSLRLFSFMKDTTKRIKLE